MMQRQRHESLPRFANLQVLLRKMTKSFRVQRRENKKRELKDSEVAKGRKFVAACYARGGARAARDLPSSTGLPVGVIRKMKAVSEKDDKEALALLLDPARSGRGRRPALARDEESLISQTF